MPIAEIAGAAPPPDCRIDRQRGCGDRSSLPRCRHGLRHRRDDQGRRRTDEDARRGDVAAARMPTLPTVTPASGPSPRTADAGGPLASPSGGRRCRPSGLEDPARRDARPRPPPTPSSTRARATPARSSSPTRRPITEPVVKGTTTLYRARFAGFAEPGGRPRRLRLPRQAGTSPASPSRTNRRDGMNFSRGPSCNAYGLSDVSAEKPVLSLVDFRRQERRAALVGVDPLHQPAVGRPDFRLAGAGRKAKDLIGLLISHGARIRRAARPRCRITLDVFTPSGNPAVEISFE